MHSDKDEWSSFGLDRKKNGKRQNGKRRGKAGQRGQKTCGMLGELSIWSVKLATWSHRIPSPNYKWDTLSFLCIFLKLKASCESAQIYIFNCSDRIPTVNWFWTELFCRNALKTVAKRKSERRGNRKRLL